MNPLIDRLIDMAFAEDIGTGDITTDSLVPASSRGCGTIIAKEVLILAGMDIATSVFQKLDPAVRFQSNHEDGAEISRGETVLEVEGCMRALLTGERTALNFLQRLSGIATHVRTYVKALTNSHIRLVDTRKTTPGWRALEKYAVRMGGAHNHRMALYDGILIKDNHIAACGGIPEAVAAARKNISHLLKIEIEVSDMAGVQQALDCGVDVIMLDNMDIAHIRQAVAIIQNRAMVEVSGGITLKNISDLSETGVDLISVGALTHSAKAVDISMQIQFSSLHQ
jgi:nicotinate-nucleotide pyrophosphorylase (carboxylating)